MATAKLNALDVSRAKTGMHGDGGGLWLQVTPTGGKSWIYRYTSGTKRREMGLGPYPAISLAQARQKALEKRRTTLAGLDPIEVKKVEATEKALAEARAMTFKQCALAYIEAHKGGWKNAKHAAQWPSTLEAYAYPVFGDLPVQGVDVGLVMKAIEPIWATKTETASRLRGRIESVLSWATVRAARAA